MRLDLAGSDDNLPVAYSPQGHDLNAPSGRSSRSPRSASSTRGGIPFYGATDRARRQAAVASEVRTKRAGRIHLGLDEEGDSRLVVSRRGRGFTANGDTLGIPPPVRSLGKDR